MEPTGEFELASGQAMGWTVPWGQ
jgi:hypothetical protein